MYVLMDFSNIAYIAFYHSLRLLSLKPEDVTEGYIEHINSFKTKVEKIINKCSSSGERVIPIFALDQYPKWKYELHKDYKAGRPALKFSPKKSLLKIIETWGWKILYSPDMEADDVIATFVARYCDEEKITVVTTDKDLWQILDHPNTTILDPSSLEYVTEERLKEKFNLEKFSQIKLHKALWGDPSDNISNCVPRMQKYLLPVIAKTEGDMEHFLEECDKATMSPRCKELLKLGKETMLMNYKLASLRYNCKLLDHKAP